VQQAERRIRIQSAQRVVGRRVYQGRSSFLPLKVNQAGVIPVIFASSLLYLPSLVLQLTGGTTSVNPSWWQRWVTNYLADPTKLAYIGVYFLLIVFFTYFYVAITFNPEERADEMKKFGGFIPGIRPGKPTADYLNFVLSRITLPGSLYLGIVAVLPNLFAHMGNNTSLQNFAFGGTSILILVSVGLDTVKQIESQLMQRNYEGFLK
jgi:preprotein translocase subunit SecY